MGEKHTPQKDATQQPAAQSLPQPRPAAQKHIEDVAVAVLVLTPGLKEIKQGGEGVLRVGLEMPVDQDVAPVADLFGEIHRIEHPAQWKPGNWPLDAQGRQIDLNALGNQGPVEEASVAGLIAGHQIEEAAQVQAACLLKLARELLEQQEAGKLRHAAAHQVALVGVFLLAIETTQPIEGNLAIEVMAVVIGFHFVEHRLEDGALPLEIGFGGLLNFGCVETRGEQVFAQVGCGAGHRLVGVTRVAARA